VEVFDMSLFERVTHNPEICHGKPCIKGTRILVSVILDELAAGKNFENIMEQYPALSREDIVSAIEYASMLTKERIEILP
jgi:uncharacterized protein (DUF433 family)